MGRDVHEDRDGGDVEGVYGEHEDDADDVPDYAVCGFLEVV